MLTELQSNLSLLELAVTGETLDSLLVDVFIALRDRLASPEQLRAALSQALGGENPPSSLAEHLKVMGAISVEDARLLESKSQAYRQSMRSLGAPQVPAVDMPAVEAPVVDMPNSDVAAIPPAPEPQNSHDAELDTFVEGSSIQPDSRSSSELSDAHSATNRAPVGTSSEKRYRKSRPHAEGGLGTVWVAEDLELGRKVALKEIQPNSADDPACRLRFLNEAEITGALEHPGIVPVYGLGTHADGRPFYAMRFVEGETLRDAIEELHRDAPQRPFQDAGWRSKFRRVLNRFLDVCNTMDYAHSRHVLHRDIKPSNIMLGDYGETLIVDWGLAKTLQVGGDASGIANGNASEVESSPENVEAALAQSPELTIHGTAIGTPAYMSPEQAIGNPGIDFRSDIYSLGATLFHLLSGKPPAGTHKSTRSADHAGQQLGKEVPRVLQSICRKAMQEAAGQRYASAKQLANDIESWLADQPVVAHQETPSERFSRAVRNHPTLTVSSAVASLLLVFAALAGLSIRSQHRLDMLEEQQARQREAESHKQQVASAVNAAAASARVEIRNDRFEAAEEFLNTALALLDSEPQLEDQRAELVAMRDRTSRLLNFYRFTEQAEELTFRDSSRRSSVLFQKALTSVGVFKQLEWWNALPSEDLDPNQVHKLRTQVYRTMFLLTALRLKQTLPGDLQVTEMLKLMSQESETSNQASLLLFDLLDAYRLSQGAELGRDFATNRLKVLNQVIAGMTFRRKTIEWDPKTVADLYIVGTALGYMVINTDAESRKPFETVLGIENAEDASREMLTRASDLQRDHFWTQLVRAFFEAQRGEHAAAWRSYSHAISLQPDNWIGYAWMGTDLRAHAISMETDDPQRIVELRRSARMLERAVDLNPNSREARTLRGDTLTWLTRDPKEVLASYFAALSLQEPLEGIDDVVVEQVDRYALESTRNWCVASAENFPDYAELYSCAAWAELQLGDDQAARKLADKAIALDDREPVANMVIVATDRTAGRLDAAAARAAELCASTPGYHVFREAALVAEAQGDLAAAESHHRRALEMAESPWQRYLAQRQIARLAIIGKSDQLAAEETRKVVALTDTERLDDLQKLAIDRKLPATARVLDGYHAGLEPETALESTARVQRLALLNGGFELGLVPIWGESVERGEQPAWNRIGGSLANGSVTDREAHVGARSLFIENTQAFADGVYSEIRQDIPIPLGRGTVSGNDTSLAAALNDGASVPRQASAPGQSSTSNTGKDESLGDGVEGQDRATWTLSLAARSDSVSASGAVVIVIDGQEVISLPSGAYDWQRFEQTIQPENSQIDLRVRCYGPAKVWLDDLKIVR